MQEFKVFLTDELAEKIAMEANEEGTSKSETLRRKIEQGFKTEQTENRLTSLLERLEGQGKKISELDKVVRQIGDHVIEHKEHTILTLHLLAEFIKSDTTAGRNFMRHADEAWKSLGKYIKTGRLTEF